LKSDVYNACKNNKLKLGSAPVNQEIYIIQTMVPFFYQICRSSVLYLSPAATMYSSRKDLGEEITMAGCYSYLLSDICDLKFSDTEKSLYVATHFHSYTESEVLFLLSTQLYW
jgi:hypothetical protein